MSTSDPVADLCVRIMNAQAAGKTETRMPSSKLKVAIANVLKDEGYISDCGVVSNAAGLPELVVQIKYFQGEPVIEKLERVSKPGRRIYRGKQKIPTVLGGLGVSIVSTSKGVMSDKKARSIGEGGEVLCLVA